jgi:hypothetical protein
MKATTLFSDFAKLIVEIHEEKKIEIPIIFVKIEFIVKISSTKMKSKKLLT